MEMNQNINKQMIDVDGFIENGKQFDIDINLPEDNRNVIFGTVKNCFDEPVENAVVKLVEASCGMGKEERYPVTHTFTNKHGEFVFGPLCPDKKYAIEIFVSCVKHIKLCEDGHREKKCLKGVKLDCCEKLTCKKPKNNCSPRI